MILTVKHKFSIYRRFEYDIGGICYTNVTSSNIKRQILYADDISRLNPYWRFFFKLYRERHKRRDLNGDDIFIVSI